MHFIRHANAFGQACKRVPCIAFVHVNAFALACERVRNARALYVASGRYCMKHDSSSFCRLNVEGSCKSLSRYEVARGHA